MATSIFHSFTESYQAYVVDKLDEYALTGVVVNKAIVELFKIPFANTKTYNCFVPHQCFAPLLSVLYDNPDEDEGCILFDLRTFVEQSLIFHEGIHKVFKDEGDERVLDKIHLAAWDGTSVKSILMEFMKSIVRKDNPRYEDLESDIMKCRQLIDDSLMYSLVHTVRFDNYSFTLEMDGPHVLMITVNNLESTEVFTKYAHRFCHYLAVNLEEIMQLVSCIAFDVKSFNICFTDALYSTEEPPKRIAGRICERVPCDIPGKYLVRSHFGNVEFKVHYMHMVMGRMNADWHVLEEDLDVDQWVVFGEDGSRRVMDVDEMEADIPDRGRVVLNHVDPLILDDGTVVRESYDLPCNNYCELNYESIVVAEIEDLESTAMTMDEFVKFGIDECVYSYSLAEGFTVGAVFVPDESLDSKPLALLTNAFRGDNDVFPASISDTGAITLEDVVFARGLDLIVHLYPKEYMDMLH